MPLDMEVGLGQGHIVLDGDPVPPKGHSPFFNFRPMFTVAEQSPISALVAQLTAKSRYTSLHFTTGRLSPLSKLPLPMSNLDRI